MFNIPFAKRLALSGHRKSGGAMLILMMMIMVIGFALGSLYLSASQRVFAMHRDTNRLKALSIAEAGLGHAFSLIAEDIGRVADSPIVLNRSFANGEYEVVASVPDNAADGVYLLTSTGTYRGQEIVSMATILISEEETEESGETPTIPLGPFGPVALLAGADLVFSGGVQVNLKDLGAHANGNVRFSGGPDLWAKYASTNGSLEMNGNPMVTLDGGQGIMHANGPVTLRGRANMNNISSSVSITGNWGVNTSATHIAPVINYPQWFNNPPPGSIQNVDMVDVMGLPPLDVEAFLTYAQSHNFYFEGNQSISRNWLTQLIRDRTGENVKNKQTLVVPDGGVMFVNGNVSLSQDMDFEGVLIATGNIVISGAATFANPTDYPALVSVDGDIRVGAGAKGLSVDGWIYAMNGNVYASGGASGMTGIVAAQNIEITGGYEIGSAGGGHAVTWPGAGGGGGGGNDEGATGTVKLLSWIR